MSATAKKSVAKNSIRVSLPADLLDNARALKLNLSHELETHLRQLVREKLSEQWRNENHEAILDTNREVERVGLWSDGLRMF